MIILQTKYKIMTKCATIKDFLSKINRNCVLSIIIVTKKETKPKPVSFKKSHYSLFHLTPFIKGIAFFKTAFTKCMNKGAGLITVDLYSG